MLKSAVDKFDRIYCLVRASSEQHGFGRLQKSWNVSGILDSIEKYEGRIHVVIGDCKKPSFGLDKTFLEENIDCVVHSAMSVTYKEPYEFLKAAWVDNFCGFVDTCMGLGISVKVVGSPLWRGVTGKRSVWSSGYSRIAWMKMRISHEFRKAGFPVNYYELGLPCVPLEGGLPQSNNLIYGMLAAADEIREWEPGTKIPVIPVDLFCDAALADMKDWDGIVYVAILNEATLQAATCKRWSATTTKHMQRSMASRGWPKIMQMTFEYEDMDFVLDASPLNVDKFGRGDLKAFAEQTLAKTLDTARSLKPIYKGEKEMEV